MDPHKTGWHGRLVISGNSTEWRFEGSYISIMREITNQLTSVNPRALASGAKSIIIDFSTQPITSASLEQERKVREIEDMLLAQNPVMMDTNRREGESFDGMIARLMQEEGIDEANANYFACEAFGIDQTARLMWMGDPRAQAFRRLNASNRAFEEADPKEYESLKHYCQSTHPEFYARMTLRE